jgi:hypothetical protein
MAEPPVRTGILVSILGDSILFHEEAADTMAIPSGALDRIEVSRGLEGHSTEWAVGGLFLGGATGAFMASEQHDYELKTVGFILYGAGIGLVLGALAGAFAETEAWEEVPLDHVFGGRIQGQMLSVPGERYGVEVAWVFSF